MVNDPFVIVTIPENRKALGSSHKGSPVFGSILLTCRTCGADVSVSDLYGIDHLSATEIVVGVVCPKCHVYARKLLPLAEAKTLSRRIRGEEVPPGRDELLLMEWHIDLDVDLTVRDFTNAWFYCDRRKFNGHPL